MPKRYSIQRTKIVDLKYLPLRNSCEDFQALLDWIEKYGIESVASIRHDDAGVEGGTKILDDKEIISVLKGSISELRLKNQRLEKYFAAAKS